MGLSLDPEPNHATCGEILRIAAAGIQVRFARARWRRWIFLIIELSFSNDSENPLCRVPFVHLYKGILPPFATSRSRSVAGSAAWTGAPDPGAGFRLCRGARIRTKMASSPATGVGAQHELQGIHRWPSRHHRTQDRRGASAGRAEIEILTIPEAQRKDAAVKAEYINRADVVFLCLPDAASRESVSLLAAGNTRTRFLDASTAHRTDPDWAYGLPELNAGQREKVARAQKVAVPGCHASGFIMLMHPLVAGGIVPADYPASTYSITGCSGGGKEMIASYAGARRRR